MSKLHYREQGSGQTVILIHGFPLNLNVWNSFAEKLSSSLQVVTVDLPGFGKSAPLQAGFTLEDVASTVHSWVKEQNYREPVIVGHSLGGYVTLALAEADPGVLSGMCLFHSTALADSTEKKDSRNKVLEFIEKQGVEAFTSNFVGQLYADPKHASASKVRTIAVQSSKETVVGYTKAMRDRKDRTRVLQNFPAPILFLAGEKDQAIPAHSIKEQALECKDAEVVLLHDVAHMGMFEAEEECQKKIQSFAQKCGVTF